MRDELRPLLGQQVVLIGRMSHCRPNAIGNLDVCLRAVDVHPCSIDAAISSLPALHIHHGWLQMPEPEHQLPGAVPLLWTTAEVESYERRSGRRDLGFRWRPSLCLDRVMQQLGDGEAPAVQMRRLNAALERINQGETYFCYRTAPNELIDLIKKAVQTSTAEPNDSFQQLSRSAKLYFKQSINAQSAPRQRSGFG